MNALKNLHFLITGGTIGSEWSPAKDTAVVTTENSVDEYIKEFIAPDFDVKHTIVAMKDSREITNRIREEILNAVKDSESENIIITHGTYTMAETARFLKKRLGKTDKRIILIGSFWPLKGYSPTDAPFNIGFAVGAINFVSPGVYVAIHATLFDSDEIVKDIEHAHFKLK
jgi:L-asparaginase